MKSAQADFITEEGEVERLFQVAQERFGRLDVLINNAGVAEDGLLVKKKGDPCGPVINATLRSPLWI